jgi:hypothetical protein
MATIELKVINKATGRVHYNDKVEIANELAQALIERLEGLAASLPVPARIAKTVTPSGDTTLEVELNGYSLKPHLPSPTFEQIYRRALPPPTAAGEPPAVLRAEPASFNWGAGDEAGSKQASHAAAGRWRVKEPGHGQP